MIFSNPEFLIFVSTHEYISIYSYIIYIQYLYIGRLLFFLTLHLPPYFPRPKNRDFLQFVCFICQCSHITALVKYHVIMQEAKMIMNKLVEGIVCIIFFHSLIIYLTVY